MLSKYGRTVNTVTLHPSRETSGAGQNKQGNGTGNKNSIPKSARTAVKGEAGILDPQNHSRNPNKMKVRSRNNEVQDPSTEHGRSQYYDKGSSSSSITARNDVNGALDTDLFSPTPSVSGPSDEEKSQEQSQESSLVDPNEHVFYTQPPNDVIDSLGVLDRVSASMQGLTERFSQNENTLEKTNSAHSNASASIVFSNRNAAPYDFMGDIEDFDEFPYEEIGNFEGPGSGLRVRSSTSFFKEREVIDTHSQHSFSHDVDVRKEQSMSREYSLADDWRRRELPALTSLRSDYHDRRDLDHFQNSLDLNLPSRYEALGADVEDSNLKLAVDKASEHANGLFAAAAKYGIYH